MIQGHKNSPYHMEQLMSQVLRHCKKSFNYCDDVFTATSGSLEDHMDEFCLFLFYCNKAGLKLKPAKLELAKQTLKILGFLWDKNSLSIPRARAQGICAIPRPRTQRQAKSFLMTCSFYRRFCPNFSDTAKDITTLTAGDAKCFKWNEDAEQSFVNMKKMIQNSISVYPPDANAIFYMSTDASQYCSASVVWQISESGIKRHVGAQSRTFTATERAFSVFKKETLSVLAGLAAFDYYLKCAHEIALFVDARSLLFLRFSKQSSPMLTRFALIIAQYNISITHINTRMNLESDLISRSRTPIEDLESLPPMTPEEAVSLLRSFTIPENTTLSISETRKLLLLESLPSLKRPKVKTGRSSKIKIDPSQLQPVQLKPRKIKFPQTTPTHRFYPNQKAQLIEQNFMTNTISVEEPLGVDVLELNAKILGTGVLTIEQFALAQEQEENILSLLQGPGKGAYRKNNIIIKRTPGGDKIVLPKCLLESILFTNHYSLFGIHNSASRMSAMIKEIYWHSNLDEIISRFVANCYFCMQNRSNAPAPSHTLGTHPLPSMPRITYCFDIACGLPTTFEGFAYIAIFTCAFSLHTTLVALKTKETPGILRGFKDRIVATFGVPQLLYSDGESAIRSVEFGDYCDDIGTKIRTSAGHSPFSNGFSETFVKKVKLALKLHCAANARSWYKDIELINNAINVTINTYKYTPEHIMFGYSIPKQQDLLSPHSQTTDPDLFADRIAEKMSKIYTSLKIHRELRREKLQTDANRNKKTKHFEVGNYVMLRNQLLQVGGGLRKAYLGPYIINKIHNSHTCDITDVATDQRKKAHFTHLKGVESPMHPIIMPKASIALTNQIHQGSELNNPLMVKLDKVQLRNRSQINKPRRFT
jgi:hypothetical protein